jgi:hypothetical protein
MELIKKCKGAIQIHKKCARETPNEEQNKNLKNMKARKLKTANGICPLVVQPLSSHAIQNYNNYNLPIMHCS